jgi:hypothetical protein
MKLRIRGNSVRLRVTQREAAALAGGSNVQETTRFGPTSRDQLVYGISVNSTADRITAHYYTGQLWVQVPLPLVRQWQAGPQVAISGRQDAGDGEVLDILVEKDFACLKPRPTEDQADAYPHPDAGRAGTCADAAAR